MRHAKAASPLTSTQDHQAEELQGLASRWTHLSPEEILQSSYVRIETVDQMVEGLQARRERWSISYYVSFEPYMDASKRVSTLRHDYNFIGGACANFWR